MCKLYMQNELFKTYYFICTQTFFVIQRCGTMKEESMKIVDPRSGKLPLKC